MSSPKLIFYLLLYVVFTASAVAVFAVGMGYPIGGSGDNLINYEPPAEESIWDSIPILGETFDTASLVGSFITATLGVLFWTLPPEIMPLWANVIFIKIPLITLIVAIVEVILP